jgi:septal ring factor EnvC (AmiA/AmiB activator)
VDGAVEDIQGASKQLGEAVGKINRTVLADQNLAHLDTTLANLAATTGDWKTASAKLEPALGEAREAIQAVRNAAAGAEKTLKSADLALAEAKPALRKLPTAVDNFSNTTAKAGEALDRMKRGEGLLGALATDNDVALDAKAFMRNLRRYGIFHYRDAPSKPDQAAEKTPFHFGSGNR